MPSAARCLGSGVGCAWLQGCPRLARDLSGFHTHITHRCSGDGFRFLYTGLALSHRATSLVSGAVHRFRLRAENGVGHSVWSPVLEVGTAATTPGEPEGLVRLGATLTSVSLVWKVRECVGDGAEWSYRRRLPHPVARRGHPPQDGRRSRRPCPPDRTASRLHALPNHRSRLPAHRPCRPPRRTAAARSRGTRSN